MSLLGTTLGAWNRCNRNADQVFNHLVELDTPATQEEMRGALMEFQACAAKLEELAAKLDGDS